MSSFLSWWQNLPLNIHPVFLQFGPVQIRYYGLMFLSAFLCFYLLMKWRIRHDRVVLTHEQLDDFLVWAIAGALIGGRVGYVVFYDLSYFLQYPLQIIWPFQKVDGQVFFGISGLSYHGGLLGVIVSGVLFCRKKSIHLWKLADAVIPAVPLGYTFGRLGNFFNGELYGRVTNAAWGMYFPVDYGLVRRHPSQLYEALFEGLVLFVILWAWRNHKIFDGFLLWVYFIFYGLVRFVIEFYRQPDDHLGLVFFQLSMGQMLCLVMIGFGCLEILRRRKMGYENHD